MVWVVVSIAGLVIETAVIVVLGRRATGSYEDMDDPVDGPPWRRSGA